MAEVSADISDTRKDMFGIASAEVENRTSADNSLAADLSTEISDRGVAIDNEASIRLSSDESLESAIAAEQSRIDVILDGSTVDLDQFAEIVDFVNGIDLENDNALLSAVTSIGFRYRC